MIWKGKKTIAVDFDGVIHLHNKPFTKAWEINDEPVPGAIEWLAKLVQNYNVIINTARIHDSRWENMVTEKAIFDWLAAHGASAEILNLIELHQDSGKPIAHMYVDDRGYCFNGKFPSMKEIDDFIPWNKEI